MWEEFFPEVESTECVGPHRTALGGGNTGTVKETVPLSPDSPEDEEAMQSQGPQDQERGGWTWGSQPIFFALNFIYLLVFRLLRQMGTIISPLYKSVKSRL